jgi:formate--tetrahydrofolate ligase
MRTDIEIAQSARLFPIQTIAENLGLASDQILPYGHYKAKLSHDYITSSLPHVRVEPIWTVILLLIKCSIHTPKVISLECRISSH